MDVSAYVRLAASFITVLIICFNGRDIFEFLAKGSLAGVPPFLVYVVFSSVIYIVVTLLISLGLVFLK